MVIISVSEDKPKKKRAAKKKRKQALEPRVKIGHRPPPTIAQMNLLCERLIENGSLKNVCDLYDDMPTRKTVYRWLLKGLDDDCEEIYSIFRHNYAVARELATDYAFDELMHKLNDIAYQPIVIDGAVLTVLNKDGEMEVVKEVTQTSLGMAKLYLDAYKWKSSKEAPTKYSDRHQVIVNSAENSEVFTGNTFNIFPVESKKNKEE